MVVRIAYQSTKQHNRLGAVLGELHAAIDKLPVLPEVAQKIMTLIHDPLSDMDTLAKEIQRDPTMSLRLLRITNSPWYGGRSDVTDLSMACAQGPTLRKRN